MLPIFQLIPRIDGAELLTTFLTRKAQMVDKLVPIYALHRGNVCPARGWSAPGACQARYLCIKYPTLAPSLSSPREVPQLDRTRPQTFHAKHVA